jgi:hypothetical protein
MRMLAGLLALALVLLTLGVALLALFPARAAQIALRVLAPGVTVSIGAWDWQANGVDLEDVAVCLPHSTASFVTATLRWQPQTRQVVVTLSDGSIHMYVSTARVTRVAAPVMAAPRAHLLPCALALTASRMKVTVSGARTPVPLQGTCTVRGAYTPGLATQAWGSATFSLRNVCAGSARMLLPAAGAMQVNAAIISSNVAHLANLFPATVGMVASASVARVSATALLDAAAAPPRVTDVAVTVAAQMPRVTVRHAEATAHDVVLDAAAHVRQPTTLTGDVMRLALAIAAGADACLTARMTTLDWRAQQARNISLSAITATGMVHITRVEADLAEGAGSVRGTFNTPLAWPLMLDHSSYACDGAVTNFNTETITAWLPRALSNVAAVVSGRFHARGTGAHIATGNGIGTADVFLNRTHIAETAFTAHVLSGACASVFLDCASTNLTRIAGMLGMPFTITRSGSFARIGLQAWLDGLDATVRVTHAIGTVYTAISRLQAKQRGADIRALTLDGTLALARPVAASERPRDHVAFVINALSGSVTGRAAQATCRTIIASNTAFVANVLTTFVHVANARAGLFGGTARLTGHVTRRKVKDKNEWRWLYDAGLAVSNINAALLCQAFAIATNRLEGVYAGRVLIAGYGARVDRLDGTLRSQRGGTLYFPEATMYVGGTSNEFQKQVFDLMFDRLRAYGFSTSQISLRYDKTNALTVVAFSFADPDHYTFEIPYHGTWLDALRLAMAFK